MELTRVRDIMQEKVITISQGESLSTAADIMRLGGVRHMPVVHGGKLVGVVSERDLLRASLSNLTHFRHEEHRAFLHGVDIARVMSAPPVTVEPDVSIEQAALALADCKIGCLPVVEGDRLIGIVTETDILRHFALRRREPRSGTTPATPSGRD